MVRFSRRSGWNSRFGGPSARLGRVSVGFGRRARGRGRRDDGGGLRRRDAAVSLRYASSDSQPEREACACHHGVHSQGGDDGLTAKAFARLLRPYPENLLQEPQLFIYLQRRRMKGRGERLGNNVLSGEIFEHRTLF